VTQLNPASSPALCACCFLGHVAMCLDCLTDSDCTSESHRAHLAGLDRLSAAVFDTPGGGRSRAMDAAEAAAYYAPQGAPLRAVGLTTPRPRIVPGCETCTVIGPLLTAPGTSGRTWQCQACGTSWTPTGPVTA
jgi:hypothetical protein